MEQKKICILCRKVYREGEFCPLHSFEPLLDLNKEENLKFVYETLKSLIFKRSNNFFFVVKSIFFIFNGLLTFFLIFYGDRIVLSIVDYNTAKEFLISLFIPEIGFLKALIERVSIDVLLSFIFMIPQLFGFLLIIQIFFLWHRLILTPAFFISKKIYPAIFKELFIPINKPFYSYLKDFTNCLKNVFCPEIENDHRKNDDDNSTAFEENKYFIEEVSFSFKAKIKRYIKGEKPKQVLLASGIENISFFTKVIHNLIYFLLHPFRQVYFYYDKIGVNRAQEKFDKYFAEIISGKS